MLRISTISLLLFIAPLFAARSLQFSGVSGYGTTQTPNAAPYLSGITSFRLEARIHSYTQTAGDGALIQIPHFSVTFHGGSNQLWITDGVDGFGGAGSTLQLDIGTRTEFLLRLTRNIDDFFKTFTAEILNVDGTSYAHAQKQITTPVASSFAGWIMLGGNSPAACNCGIAWVRWGQAVLEVGAYPPGDHNGAWSSLWDAELEGNGNDGNGVVPSLAFNGTRTFATTPARAPAATIYSPISIRAGVSNVIDGSHSSSFIDNAALTYAWSITARPPGSAAQLSATNIAAPAFSPDKFGQYTLRLQVTDANAVVSGPATMDIGAVFTDDNHVVQFGDPALDFVFGPIIQYGYSPWGYHDANHKAMSEAYGDLAVAAAGEWAADWTTAVGSPPTNTIAVTQGSTTITGTGTNFRADFCGGGTSPPQGTWLVAWYSPVLHYPMLVISCNSATQMIVGGGTTAAVPSMSGVNYSRMRNGSNFGCAQNAGTFANFYDSVLAHYNLYYRSGLTKYLTYARTLADRWYDSPCFTSFRYNGPQRNWNLTGVMWRALEGGLSAYWTDKLYPILDNSIADAASAATITDVREQAYEVAFLALGGKLAPDAAKRTSYTNAVNNAATAKWGPQQQPEGNWVNLIYGVSPWNGQPGTAAVQNGNAVVTGVGTSWGTDWCSAAKWGWPQVTFWIAANASGAKGDDNNAYLCTMDDANHVRLQSWRGGPSTYQGASGTLKGWQFSNLTGWATQPFQLGIVGSAWNYAYKLTGRAQQKQFVMDIGHWLAANAIQASSKGLYGARVSPTCEPISDNIRGCSYDPNTLSGDWGVWASRFMSGEITNAMSAAYTLGGEALIKTKEDLLMGACLGKLGGVNTDGVWCQELDEATDVPGKAKDFGYWYGFGNAAAWPAARLAGAAPAGDPVTVKDGKLKGVKFQ